MRINNYWTVNLVLLVVLLGTVAANGQTSSFTYQGRLTDGGTAASATYDMQFKLFDASRNQVGATITNPAVMVTRVTHGWHPVSITTMSIKPVWKVDKRAGAG